MCLDKEHFNIVPFGILQLNKGIRSEKRGIPAVYDARNVGEG